MESFAVEQNGTIGKRTSGGQNKGNEYCSHKSLNKEYLKRIALTTPEEFRVFYADLNNIDVE